MTINIKNMYTLDISSAQKGEKVIKYTNAISSEAKPFKKYIKFNAGKEKNYFSYWDKNEKQEIQIVGPIKLIVLDVLSTVIGYSKKYNTGVFANEVKDLKTSPLFLNIKLNDVKTTIMSGLYFDMEDKIVASGLKLANSVYSFVEFENGNKELVHFSLSGAAMFKFNTSEITPGDIIIFDRGQELIKKGGISYFPPNIVKIPKDPEFLQEAQESIEKLTIYLNSYFKNNDQPTQPEVKTTQPEIETEIDKANLPF